MSTYTSEYPAKVDIDPAIKKYFEEFYKVSDQPTAHEEYASQFTKDATFILGSKKVQGTDGIIAMRHGMWEKVSGRTHNPVKIFPFGQNADEVMLYGDVAYEFKAGGKASKEWGARAHFVKEDGKLKMDFYQVFLDTAA